MNDRFKSKVAFVTGAARGMGAEHARSFVREGGSVVIADVRDDEGAHLTRVLGPRTTYLHLDITDFEQWQSAVARAESEFGPIDILVNNAAILLNGAIDVESPEQYRRLLDVNLTGAFLGMRTVSPLMRARGSGSIVNIASAAGLIGYPNSVGYVSAKWGMRGLGKAAALDLAGSGVRVNTVYPGPTETPMVGSFNDDSHASYTNGQSISRWAKPSEVSRMVLFLASDESSYCTGGDFAVDGGASLGLIQPSVSSR